MYVGPPAWLLRIRQMIEGVTVMTSMAIRFYLRFSGRGADTLGWSA